MCTTVNKITDVGSRPNRLFIGHGCDKALEASLFITEDALNTQVLAVTHDEECMPDENNLFKCTFLLTPENSKLSI